MGPPEDGPALLPLFCPSLCPSLHLNAIAFKCKDEKMPEANVGILPSEDILCLLYWRISGNSGMMGA